eukprot:gene932-10689_t
MSGSEKVRESRHRMPGHCVSHKVEIAVHLVLWEPTRGKQARGKRAVTYLENLNEETNQEDTSQEDTGKIRN